MPRGLEPLAAEEPRGLEPPAPAGMPRGEAPPVGRTGEMARGMVMGRGLAEPGFTIDGTTRGDRPKRESRGAPLGLEPPVEGERFRPAGLLMVGLAALRGDEPRAPGLVMTGLVARGLAPAPDETG